MAIRIWRNPNFLGVQDRLNSQHTTYIQLDALELMAIANTDHLGKAWALTQAVCQTWEQPWIQTISPGRTATAGDVMQTKDNQYWLITQHQFLPLIGETGSKYLTPSICKEFQFKGLWPLKQTFKHDGLPWQVVKILEYDLQNSTSTLIACQKPTVN